MLLVLSTVQFAGLCTTSNTTELAQQCSAASVYYMRDKNICYY